MSTCSWQARSLIRWLTPREAVEALNLGWAAEAAAAAADEGVAEGVAMETAAAAPTQQIAMTSWADEVAALGKSHAAKLRKYVIATNTDAQFRHVDMIREGWSTGDEGRSLTDGRIEWASPVFVDKLVRMGREAVEAAVVKQEEHETAVYSDTLFCLLYTSPSPRDHPRSRMPSSA